MKCLVDWGAMSGWGLGYNVYTKEWSKAQLDILDLDIKYMPKIGPAMGYYRSAD